MKNYYGYALLLLISGCSKEKRKDTGSAAEPYAYSYAVKNDTISQTLDCNLVDGTKMEFLLHAGNAVTKEHFQLSGTASKVIYEFDGETESDEEGNGYLVDEYVFKDKNCTYTIAIDSEEYQMVKIGNTCNNKNLVAETMRISR
jgi:hypothetical protein